MSHSFYCFIWVLFNLTLQTLSYWQSIILQFFGGGNGAFNINHLQFPHNFLFGATTSAYSTEGAWNASGKGEHIWDRLVHTHPDAIIDGENGDVASNSYYKYKEGIKVLNEIGFQVLRFSISWSRLFPEGFPNKLNEEGVRHYNAEIDEILSKGIQPMVTLYHWDLPQPLQDVGGWLNSTMVDIFGEYAKRCFQLFGDRVKWWITFNEPTFMAAGYGGGTYASMVNPSDQDNPQSNVNQSGFEGGSFAPMINLHGTGEYISAHNILKAHAKAYRIYEKEFKGKQGGKVSIVLLGTFYIPKNESSSPDIEAVERAYQFEIGWFAHPIFSEEGDYPGVMKEFVSKNSLAEGRSESRLPKFTPNEINELKGSCDFFAISHFATNIATAGETGQDPSIDRDKHVVLSLDPNWPETAVPPFRVVPEGISGVLRWIKQSYNNIPVYITDNGYADKGELIDMKRISYHTEYLKEVLAAMNDGCKVIGYNVYSIIDGFEWVVGYTAKFGLVHVDFKKRGRPRTRKLSSKFFQTLIRSQSRKGS